MAKKRGIFLRAEWRKLAMANYTVPPELLLPLVPRGTELDLYEGRCYVSLVGFMFLNTKVLGIPIPFHRNFEEVNLRFYLKREDPEVGLKRGVAFVKEIVPKRMITFVARTLYGEPYQTLPMRHEWKSEADRLRVRYSWKSGEWQHFTVESDAAPVPLQPDSEAAFITEHYWGYTRLSDTRTAEYEVTHPTWEVYPVRSHDIRVDFGRVYGPEYAFLNEQEPYSVLLAEGSEITVGKGGKI